MKLQQKNKYIELYYKKMVLIGCVDNPGPDQPVQSQSCQDLTGLLTELLEIGERIIVCVEVLWPSQPNGVMSSAVSLPNHKFTEQA